MRYKYKKKLIPVELILIILSISVCSYKFHKIIYSDKVSHKY